MKYLFNKKIRDKSFLGLKCSNLNSNGRVKSFEYVFTEEFLLILKSYKYYSLWDLSYTVKNYLNIVLTEEIKNGVILSFDGEIVNEDSIFLERSVSIGRKYSWIINELIDDNGYFSTTVLIERLCSSNNFTVPTKNY